MSMTPEVERSFRWVLSKVPTRAYRVDTKLLAIRPLNIDNFKEALAKHQVPTEATDPIITFLNANPAEYIRFIHA